MTFQEKLQISGNVTLVGVTVVFLILVSLVFVIVLSAQIIMLFQKKDQGTDDVTDQDYQTQEEELPWEGSNAATVDLVEGMDSELVAVIMSAITATLEPGTGFRLRSIRRTANHVTVWNRSGRNEYLATRL